MQEPNREVVNLDSDYEISGFEVKESQEKWETITHEKDGRIVEERYERSEKVTTVTRSKTTMKKAGLSATLLGLVASVPWWNDFLSLLKHLTDFPGGGG
ncbi:MULTISPECIES: hypothetical protein [Vibrio]|uniref:hypothetical protein n=1 Tax=Vibrio TaxID=662 RepID=UPI00148E85A2|nr:MULTISPECIES: hypothetical protein [Vibrio]MBU2931224.1 hypothetical protein [Vibrio cyclitrophicus]NOJ06399.1 hypothetical protein [Vibrio splendidus]